MANSADLKSRTYTGEGSDLEGRDPHSHDPAKVAPSRRVRLKAEMQTWIMGVRSCRINGCLCRCSSGFRSGIRIAIALEYF